MIGLQAYGSAAGCAVRSDRTMQDLLPYSTFTIESAE